MDYMSLYYTKEAECQEKSKEITDLKQKILMLERKLDEYKGEYLWLNATNAWLYHQKML